MKSLKDKVALVTGGAQGIGYAVTRKLTEEGAKVLFVDLDEPAAAKVQQELGPDASAFVTNLLTPDAPQRAVDAAVEQFGTIDIIVNNAGFHWDAPFHRMTDAQWQTMLDIHVTVPFRILRAAAPHLFAAAQKDAAEGAENMRKIVNVSSLAASFGVVGAANYSAAKAGAIGLTKALAKEWGRHRINVNAVAFGVIQTRFGLPQSDANKIQVGDREIPLGVPLKTLEAMGLNVEAEADVYAPRPIKGIPLGRAGHISEAADTIYFLCSPLSNYMTGQVLVASGGSAGGMS